MVSARGSLNLLNHSKVYILFPRLRNECIYNSVIKFDPFIFPFLPIMYGTGILTSACVCKDLNIQGRCLGWDCVAQSCAVVLDVVDTGSRVRVVTGLMGG